MDLFEDDTGGDAPGNNTPEFSVSELSGAVKKSIENEFGFVKVRGEVGRVWMDAVVGNPPFAGKNGITKTGGPSYLTWLTSAFTPSHGNADLSAYFFRRAAQMLGTHGTLGLTHGSTHGTLGRAHRSTFRVS